VNGDRAELEALRALDPQAVSSVHARYFPQLYRYARYRLGDSSAAEDVASEALVRLLEAVAAGSGPTSTLRGWLLGTAANLINDSLRRRYAKPEEGLSEEIAAEDPTPHDHAEGSEAIRAVRAAILRLTADQQHVLALRFGSEYTLEETAAILRKKTNAVKALQFRALAALRRAMEEAAS
jgi:RNA polymerase sigma-70 factor (ECF subfamily)